MNMGRKSILIVEDELITAMDIQMRLAKHGYESVHFVATGEEAIDMVHNGNIGLILMDIKLKGVMDGIRTTKYIRTKFGIPIIYISGNSDTHMLKRLNDTGPAGIIIKPINEAQLFKSVDDVLRNRA